MRKKEVDHVYAHVCAVKDIETALDATPIVASKERQCSSDILNRARDELNHVLDQLHASEIRTGTAA